MENEQCCGKLKKMIENYCQYLMKWQYRYKISDAAITELFKSIALFLWMCTMFGVFTVKNKAVGFLSWIPNSLYKARKLLKLNRDDFDKYVPCPKWQVLYYKLLGKEEIWHSEFTGHCTRKGRRPCATILMKTVVSETGREFLIPRRVHWKISQRVLEKARFQWKMCFTWRISMQLVSTYTDIYDGRLWTYIVIFFVDTPDYLPLGVLFREGWKVTFFIVGGRGPGSELLAAATKERTSWDSKIRCISGLRHTQ